VEQAAGLQAVDLLERVAKLLRVGMLAADHPERRLDELARDERRRIGERQPERLGEARVAGEDGGRLVELSPGARPPATELVAVDQGRSRCVAWHPPAPVCARSRAASPARSVSTMSSRPSGARWR